MTTIHVPFERWTNMPWLDERTILLTVHGSRAYGLNRATSDVDVKGIAVPPREVLHGYLSSFEQAELREPIDCVIFDIRKFCRLAAEANPNIIEILFTDPKHWIRTTPQHERLWRSRHLFLSRRVRYTFAGYAHAQLKRIEGHYRWLKHPPTHKPTRAEFKLPEGPTIPKEQRDTIEGLIKARLASWRLDLEPLDEASKIQFESRMEEILLEIGIASRDDLWEAAGRSLGLGDNLMEVLRSERTYRSKCEEWDAFRQWQRNRNAARHELEAKFGYDTKHAMHLVRLLRMAGEMLRMGEVIVERPDREELLAIRDGAWTYEALVDWAKAQDAELERMYKDSTLQREPDRAAIDRLCREVVESML
jgi:predicted nucleotidyltransferase